MLKQVIILILTTLTYIIGDEKFSTVINGTLSKIDNEFNDMQQNLENLKGLVHRLPVQEHMIDFQENMDYVVTTDTSITSKKLENCTCAYYYLCNMTTGTIITDGTSLIMDRLPLSYSKKLTSRLNPNDHQHFRSPIDIAMFARRFGQENRSRMERQADNDQSTCTAPRICCEISQFPEIKKDSIKSSIPKCGIRTQIQEPSMPVLEGFSKYGEYPWTTVIQGEKNKHYIGVGSLIHPRVILTAANNVKWTESYMVRLGVWNLDSISPEHSRNVPVIQILKHPNYNENNLFYNAALLVLRSEFNITDTIRTICLPSSSTVNENDCVASGWGWTSTRSKHSDVMKKVQLKLLSANKCESHLKNTRLGERFELHSSFQCAYGLLSKDLCNGDGGAPLVCPAQNQENQMVQMGITSWGLECSSDLPTMFTNVSYVKDWIDGQFDSLGFNKAYYTLTD